MKLREAMCPEVTVPASIQRLRSLPAAHSPPSSCTPLPRRGNRPGARESETSITYLQSECAPQPLDRSLHARRAIFPKEELFLPETVHQGACLQEREGRWPAGRASVSQGGTHSPSGSFPCLGLEPGGKKPRRKLRKHQRKPLRKS